MSSDKVDELIEGLDHPLTAALVALRAVVLEADPRIREEVKWNSPSFAITEHFATTNLRPKGPLLLVLHAGAKATGADLRSSVVDDAGLLDWKSGERAILSFPDASAVTERRDDVLSILRGWISATQ